MRRKIFEMPPEAKRAIEAKRGKKGRDTKLTPQRFAKLIEILREGNTYKTAARLVGIDSETLRIWMRRGEQGKEPYASFYRAALAAEEEAIRFHARNVKRIAAQKDNLSASLQASTWFLGRRRPEEWGKREFLTTSVSGQVTQHHEYRNTIVQLILQDETAYGQAEELLRSLASHRVSETIPRTLRVDGEWGDVAALAAPTPAESQTYRRRRWSYPSPDGDDAAEAWEE